MPRKILIVEDEVIVGLDLMLQLEDEGYECLGPARTPGEALALIRQAPPDFAVLDINLNGATSADVATRLKEIEKPFVYVSGYGANGVVDEMPPAPVIQKPLRFERLMAVIGQTLV